MKFAKTQYEIHLSAYVKAVIRRPLGKLLEFFEGIDELLLTKTPEEVGFHANYNKTALRKVLSMFPGKEVKKSLSVLYKRVDKHFTNEAGLLQVVWHGIQEAVIQMHHQYEQVIAKCYPQSEIHLPFTIDDLLAYFSEIAREH